MTGVIDKKSLTWLKGEIITSMLFTPVDILVLFACPTLPINIISLRSIGVGKFGE